MPKSESSRQRRSRMQGREPERRERPSFAGPPLLGIEVGTSRLYPGHPDYEAAKAGRPIFEHPNRKN
jgi:hypothetical protein